MVGATHGEDAFGLVQNLFRFHDGICIRGAEIRVCLASGGPSVPSLPVGNWI